MGLEIYKDSNLVSKFREFGLYFLIPDRWCSLDDVDCPVHEDDDSFDSFHFMGDDGEEFADGDYDGDDYGEAVACRTGFSVDDLLIYFNCDFMDYADFFVLSPWDLFGVTPAQFRMIDFSCFDLSNLWKFLHVLHHKENKYLSIEQRIRWATVVAQTDCDRIHLSLDGKNLSRDALDYCRRVSLSHNNSDSVVLIGLYKDYCRFLPDALILDRRRDSDSAFHYSVSPKPAHFRDLHDKAFRDYRVIEAEKAKARLDALNFGISGVSRNPEYRRFLYGDGHYAVTAPKDYADFEREGEFLNHCVESYAQDFADGKTFIYFIRSKENPDCPFYTAEVQKSRHAGSVSYKLVQCYTHNNDIYKTDDFREFLVDWCKTKRILVECDL